MALLTSDAFKLSVDEDNFEASTTEDLTIIFAIMFLFVVVVIRLLP